MKLHHAGKFEMILPTVANLEPLVDMNSVDEVMRWANELSDIPEILPAIVIASDGSPTVLLLPALPAGLTGGRCAVVVRRASRDAMLRPL